MAATGIVSLLIQAKNDAAAAFEGLKRTLGVEVPAAAAKAQAALVGVGTAGGKDIGAPGQLAKDLNIFNKAQEGTAFGARRLERALETMLFAASGLPGEIGHVAGAFSVFAVGGEIAVGIAALSAVIGLWAESTTKNLRDITKAADDAAKKLNEAAGVRSGQNLTDQVDDQRLIRQQLIKERDEIQHEIAQRKSAGEAFGGLGSFATGGLVSGFRTVAQSIGTIGAGGSVAGGVGGFFSLDKQLKDVNDKINALKSGVQEGVRAVDEFRDANDRAVDSLERVAGQRTLTGAELKKLADLQTYYNGEVKKNQDLEKTASNVALANARADEKSAQEKIDKITSLQKGDLAKINELEQTRVELLGQQAVDITRTDAARFNALTDLRAKEQDLLDLRKRQEAVPVNQQGPLQLQAGKDTDAQLKAVQAAIAAAVTRSTTEAIKALETKRAGPGLTLTDLPQVQQLLGKTDYDKTIAKSHGDLPLINQLEAQHNQLLGLANDIRKSDGELTLRELANKAELLKLTQADLTLATSEQARFTQLSKDASLTEQQRLDYAEKEKQARAIIIGYQEQQAALSRQATDESLKQLQTASAQRDQVAKEAASAGKDLSTGQKKADRAAEIEALQRLTDIQAGLNARIAEETQLIKAAANANDAEAVKRLTAQRQQTEQELATTEALKAQTQEQLNANDATLQFTKELKAGLDSTISGFLVGPLDSLFLRGVDGFHRLRDAAKALGLELTQMLQKIAAQALTNEFLKVIFGVAKPATTSATSLGAGQVAGAIPKGVSLAGDAAKSAQTTALTTAGTTLTSAGIQLDAAAAQLIAAAAAMTAGGAGNADGGLLGGLGGLLGGLGGAAATGATLSGDAASLGTVFAAAGGVVAGPGTGTSDSIPAMLSHGEGILTARAVQALGGAPAVSYLNGLGVRNYRAPRFATGGVVGAASGASARVDGAIAVGLEDGLVSRHLQTPEGQRTLIRVVAKNRNALNSVLGR